MCMWNDRFSFFLFYSLSILFVVSSHDAQRFSLSIAQTVRAKKEKKVNETCIYPNMRIEIKVNERAVLCIQNICGSVCVKTIKTKEKEKEAKTKKIAFVAAALSPLLNRIQ